MTHPVDDMLDDARAAIAAMKEAAVHARAVHARAELMRHMRTTAQKLATLPLDEAVQKVSGEWMQAWGLGRDAYPGLAADVTRFTEAFCRDARGEPAPLREMIAALDAGFTSAGLSLADEMAKRSECAHGWWAAVVPRDPKAAPFWANGAPPHCGAEQT